MKPLKRAGILQRQLSQETAQMHMFYLHFEEKYAEDNTVVFTDIN